MKGSYVYVFNSIKQNLRCIKYSLAIEISLKFALSWLGRALSLKSFASPEVEDTSICRDATTKAQIKDDTIVLPEFTISSFQIVADILAKSVILAYYEVQTTSAFERIEPFTVSLQH